MAEEKDLIGQETITKAQKVVGLIETMGCACLNLGCLFLIIGILSLIAMIVGAVTNPLEAIKAILGSLWGAISGTK